MSLMPKESTRILEPPVSSIRQKAFWADTLIGSNCKIWYPSMGADGVAVLIRPPAEVRVGTLQTSLKLPSEFVVVNLGVSR